jgi:negative regulator of flagellin synthesis FlgM
MKVNPTGTNQVQDNNEVSKSKKASKTSAAQENERSGKAATSGSSSAVKSDISNKGKEFAKVKAAATGAPDVREQKIAELKKRIAEGKYKIDDNAIADKMVDEHLSTSGLG